VLLLDISTFEDETTVLSCKVGKHLPIDVAPHPRRMEASDTPLQSLKTCGSPFTGA